MNISGSHERNFAEDLSIGLVYMAIAAAALVGNTTIVIIYFKRRTTFKVTYIFLLSLTLANLIVSVAVMPLSIISLISGRWVFGSNICTVSGFIFTWMATVTIQTVLLISFHRATVVLSPFHTLIHTRGARCLAALVWTVSLVVPVPPLVGVSTYEYSPLRGFCRVRFVSYADVDEYPLGNTYSMITVVLFVMLPLLFICLSNIALYRVSRRLLKIEQQHKTTSARISRTIGGEVKALRTVTLVMGVFVLCWVPQIVLTMYGVISQKIYHPHFHTLQALCIFLNSALNPYIYIYTNKEMRKQCMELCFCTKTQSVTPGSFRRFNNRCSSSPSALKSYVSSQSECNDVRPENGPLRNNFVRNGSTDTSIQNGEVLKASSIF